MRRSTRSLLWGAGLLCVAGAAVMLFVGTRDAEFYRRALERELSSVLSRKVTVGTLSFDLSLRPTLSVRDLRIANPAWASRPHFASASRAEVRIDLVALWHGRVELRAVRLQGLDLLFERNAEGANNWRFGTPDGDDAPVDLPDFDAISLTQARIGWRGSDGSLWQAQVEHAQATIRDDAPFELSAQSIYRETPVGLSVKSDVSLQAAVNGKALHLTAQLDPRGAHLSLEARLASLGALYGAELTFEARGDRLDAWSQLVQRPLPAWGPYRVSARVRDALSGVQLDELRLTLDGLPMAPSRIEIETGSAVFGAKVDMRLTGQGKLGDAPFSFEASSAPWPRLTQGTDLVSAAARIQLAELEVSAQGKAALAPGVPEFDLVLAARGDALVPVRVFAGAQPRRAVPVDLSARLTHTSDRFALDGIRGHVLGCTVAGNLAYSDGARPQVKGALTLGRLDLAQPDIAALRAAGPEQTAPHASGPAAWLERFDADLSLRVAAVEGWPIPVRGVAARAQLRSGVLGLQGVSATLAEIDVSGEGTLRWSEGRPQAIASIRIPVLDAARLRGPSAAPSGAADAPLPFEPLRALDATLQLAIGHIAGTTLPLRALTASARLQRGNLTVDPLSVSIAEVPVHARASLDATERGWHIRGDARVARVDVAGLLRTLKRPASASGTIADVQLAFDTQGASPRELLAQTRVALHSDSFALQAGSEHAPLAVERARVEATPGGPLRLIVIGSAFGAPMDLTVTGGPLVELLQPERAWPTVQLDMRTALRGEFLRIAATSGPLQRLIGMRKVPIVLHATLPGAQGVFEGTIDDLAEPAGTPLTGRIEVASLARTGALFTAARLPDVALTASGRMTLGEGEISFDDLALQAGKSDLRGRVRIRWRERAAVVVDLDSKLLDTTQWMQATSDEAPLLDRRVPLPSLLAQDAQLRLRAERLILPSYDLARVDLGAALDKGLLEFSAGAAEGDLRGELRFDARQSVPAVAARLSLHEFESQTLYTAAADRSGAPTPLVSMRAQLVASGATLREMLATGRGEMLITAGRGTLPIGSSYGLEQLAGNVLLTLVPGRKTDDFAQIECAAARFALANGVATSTDGIALRFKRLDVLGGGAIQLTSGKILFGYRAVRRNWLSFSVLGLTSGLARVTGTIRHPAVELDPSGVLFQGTAAWATAGLSLLAGDLWRKLEATGDPCARIAAGARSSSDPLEQLIRSLPSVKLPRPPGAQP